MATESSDIPKTGVSSSAITLGYFLILGRRARSRLAAILVNHVNAENALPLTLKEPQPQEPSRVFSLLPNYTLKRQYVDIDERTLGMLLKEVTDELRRRLTGQPEGVGVSDARRRTTRFADFEFTGWRLGISNFISTCDGSSHSPTVPTCWSRETNLPLLPSQLWKHRGSADPGLADIFVASNGHQNTEPAAEYRSMSTAEYYNRAAAYKK